MRRAWLGIGAVLVACGSYPPDVGHVGGPLPADDASVPIDASFDVANPVFPCDIAAVLSSRCWRCHTQPQQNGAPFPLLTWQDTRASYLDTPIWRLMIQAVSTDYMPFMGDPKLKPPVQPLSASQKQTLLDWLHQGGPPASGVVCP
jgi:hypothetical protein